MKIAKVLHLREFPSTIKLSTVFFDYKTDFFPFQNNSKTDLDLWDCFENKKNLIAEYKTDPCTCDNFGIIRSRLITE